MKRFALLCLVGIALLAAIIINESQSVKAAAKQGEVVSTQAGGGLIGQQVAPNDSEFLQISFPVSKKDYGLNYDYSSWVDHSASGASDSGADVVAPNYQDNGRIVPYTGEIATTPDPQGPPGFQVMCRDILQTPSAYSRTYCYEGHPAYDIPVVSGSNVFAAHAGFVISAFSLCKAPGDPGYDPIHDPYSRTSCNNYYGNEVVIRDATQLYYTKYAHLKYLNVFVDPNNNNMVARGQLLALSDNTGSSGGPHVHFGLTRYMVNETSAYILDPAGWYSAESDPLNPNRDGDHIQRWASGYPVPSNSTTDRANWNEGPIISNYRLDKNGNYVNNPCCFPIGDAPTTSQPLNHIERDWANNYGGAGAPDGAPYNDPNYGRCQNFEGGTSCPNSSDPNAVYRTVALPTVIPRGSVLRYFSDTPLTHWAHRYIGWAAREGIVNGYAYQYCNDPGGDTISCPFRPDEGISRGEFAAILQRAGIPLITGHAQDFCDVPPTHWAYDYIETVYNTYAVPGDPTQRIMDGTGSAYCPQFLKVMPYFVPNRIVIRGEVSIGIVRFGRYLHFLPAYYEPTSLQGAPDYYDVQSSSYAYTFVETLYNYGVIKYRHDTVAGAGPSEGWFYPGDPGTRAQVTMFLHELVYAPHHPNP